MGAGRTCAGNGRVDAIAATHEAFHWWHRRRQKNGKEGTWKQTAEQAGYWMGLVAVALFILIGWASDAASIDGVEA